jgi:hypothetical protein
MASANRDLDKMAQDRMRNLGESSVSSGIQSDDG